MVSKKSRSEVRVNKHRKLRNRFSGTAERPRLAVFRSNNHMYAQIIDDTVGNTLVSASTLQKDVKAELEKTNNVEAAAYLGTVIAKKAIEKGITSVVFDRGGFIYHEIARKLQLSDSALDIFYTIFEIGDNCLQRDICKASCMPKQTVNSSIRKLQTDTDPQKKFYRTLRIKIRQNR